MVIASLPSFSTPQDALDARATDLRLTVYIGGVLTPVTSFSHQHSAGQKATATITMPLPAPAQVTSNAPVIVQGGHNDLIGTLFAGTIPAVEYAMTRRGDTLTVECVGHLHALDEPLRDDVTFAGPVAADAVFAALASIAGVPATIAEAATFPNGEALTLGGNVHIDDGAITIRAHSSPRSQFGRLVDPYGYVVSDTPAGPVRFHRVSGSPDGTPVVVFREGTHLGDSYRNVDWRTIVNAWDINGATYEDEQGGEVPIRSIADPDVVPAHPDIVGGYRYRREQNSDIVRADQAEAVRQRMENDYGDATATIRWEAVEVPFLAPGDVVQVESETIGASGLYWLRSIDGDGATATYEAWTGTGEVYPGVVDRTTQVIQTAPVHLGDESVAWYAVPSPSGTSKTWPITIDEDASAVNVRGWHHSWNSQTVAGEDTELTVSRWEVWLPGVDMDDDDNQPEASGTLPHMPERYGSRPNFSTFTTAAGLVPGDDGYVVNAGEWAPFAISLGRLDAGDYVLRLICGEKAGVDDGEVRAVYLEQFGLTQAAGYEGVS